MIELIVNKNKEEKIIAVVENGKLVEIYEENEQNIKARNEGNIYIGIVKDIVPGMQAAFVDIGTEKNSFIHLVINIFKFLISFNKYIVFLLERIKEIYPTKYIKIKISANFTFTNNNITI